MIKSLTKTSIFVAFLYVLILSVSLGYSQTKPVVGLHENIPNVVAITNAKIFISPEKVIEKGTLLIRDGLIQNVGKSIKIPDDAVIRDAEGKTIYPGFIDLVSDYGIPKPRRQSTAEAAQAAPSSRRAAPAGAYHWNSSVHPEKKASEIFSHVRNDAETLRKQGFTAVLTYPIQGFLKGSGTLVLINDSEPNSSTLKDELALFASFTRTGESTAFGFGSSDYPASLMGAIALLRQTFYDADWYKTAWEYYHTAPEGQKKPDIDIGLQALQPYISAAKPIIMETSDELSLLRAYKIANEFKLNMWILGSGYEYRRLDAVKNTGMKIILPLNFPKEPDVSTPEKEVNVSLRELRHWYLAPANPAKLAGKKINFSLTSAGLTKKSDFLSKLREAVTRGLSKEEALKALTVTPAEWIKMSNLLGTLDKNKLANFLITDGDIFEAKTKILDTWVAGKQFEVTVIPEVDIRGDWNLTIKSDNVTKSGTVKITGTAEKPKADIEIESKKIKVTKLNIEAGLTLFTFKADSIGFTGVARMSGILNPKQLTGTGIWGDGNKFSWNAELTKEFEEKKKESKKKEEKKYEDLVLVYPEGAYGIPSPPEQPEYVLVKNARIWTSGPQGIIENGDLLVKNGKIEKVGKDLKAPGNALIIYASGKHVTPGIIDDHSHICTSGNVNEWTEAITPEVRIEDVLTGDDISAYRQLAGGTTACVTLHGSANPIGGQYSAIKLRWGALPDELPIEGAKPGQKFALGENVKQASRPTGTRYPRTRMGVDQIIRDAFTAAKEYNKEWDNYNAEKKKNKYLIPPRKILRYEPLLEILEGKRIIHCHSYRQDGILAMIRLAEEIGFKVDLFIHCFEGYKVAEELKKHGAMVTASSDWWQYKFEAWDGIPYNGALMWENGLIVSYNSDSSELGRRMNTEAAKAVKYGNVPEEEALKFVTINSAKHMFADDKIGSLEPGKDADFVIWNGSPLSSLSKCEQTWVDGRKYFDIEDDKNLREEAKKIRAFLVQKILDKGGNNAKGKPPVRN